MLRVLLVFPGERESGNSPDPGALRVWRGKVPNPADPDQGPALMGLRISPAQPAIDRVTRAEDGGCLLIRNLVGNQIGCVGIHQHVLGMSALCFNSCALQIVTEHSAAALAPFAAPARGLNPGGPHAVAHLSRGDVRGHANNLADRLVAEDSGEWSRQVSERLMYVGVADAACMHLHEHLVRSGLRLRNVFDLPRTAHSGNDGGLHNTSS